MSKQITIQDFHDRIRDLHTRHANRPPTVTVRPDGFYEDDEPDTDEGPLAEGDVVRWNIWKTRLIGGNLAPFGGRRPYILGVVTNTDVAICIPDHVGVRMSTGVGGQFPRDHLRLD